MTQTYIVTGMTCNGCKASVEKALQTIASVNNVSVDLKTKQVAVASSSKISLKDLQNALPEKFNILVKTTNKNELQQLFPLFLIFVYIVAASILINYKSWNTSEFMLDFMGLFYVVFSFFKLLDIKGFANTFKMYDPLAKLILGYSWIYPFIEVVLGLLFLTRTQIPFALIVTIIVLGITFIGVTRVLLDKKTIQCACLGTALKLPMTKATIIENSIMLIMAIVMLTNICSL